MYLNNTKNVKVVVLIMGILFGVYLSNTALAVSQLYWTETYAGKIMASNLDGTDKTTILSSISGPKGIAIDSLNQKVYCVSSSGSSTSKIIRCNLDGSNIENLATNLTDPWAIDLDIVGGKMYWSDLGGGGFQRIYRANLDGSGKEILYTGNGCEDLELDLANHKLYFTEYISGSLSTIKRFNLDGSNLETLITGLSTPKGIALDIEHQKIYWTDSGTDKIQKANFNGTGIEDVVTSSLLLFDIPFDLELANGKIYWADYGYNVIHCANIDGSDISTIASGLNRPSYLSIIPEPGMLILLGFGSLVLTRKRKHNR